MTRAASAAPRGDVIDIGAIRWRERVRIRGHVRSLRLHPIGEGITVLECTIVDGSGGITIAFLGRRRVAGIELGRRLEAEGMVAEVRERLTIINPSYRLLGS